VRVRPATGEDFDRVTALLEELGRPKVADDTRADCRSIFERHLVDDRAAHLVAEDDDGEVVGFCSLHFRDRLNYTTPAARGRRERSSRSRSGEPGRGTAGY
jgi:hypothetical protein